jgi:hypothetical protein
LTAERWSAFPLGQQILMIANEMHRASKLFAPEHRDRLRSSYERVLRLTDLTVQVQRRLSFRRELLRWRDLVASLYIAHAPSAPDHRSALRALLQLNPTSAPQVALLLGS